MSSTIERTAAGVWRVEHTSSPSVMIRVTVRTGTPLSSNSLVLANTAFAESVDHFWHHHIEVVVGPIHLDESLVHWVNDGLMTIFFFVAGATAGPSKASPPATTFIRSSGRWSKPMASSAPSARPASC